MFHYHRENVQEFRQQWQFFFIEMVQGKSEGQAQQLGSV